MNWLQMGILTHGPSEQQLLSLLGQIAQANYELAKSYSSLHSSGFADWHASLQQVLATRKRVVTETLGSQIQDTELNATFYALWEHLQRLSEVDQQIVAWLAGFAGLTTMHDKRDRAKLDRRLRKIASGGSEGAVGPVWAGQPGYQALADQSRQIMMSITQIKQHFDRRLKQLLSEVPSKVAAAQPEQPPVDSEMAAAVTERLLRSLPKDMQRLVVTSKLEGEFTYLQMEIVTFTDLWKHAQVVVDFIERVWDSFKPFQVKLEATTWSRWAQRTSEPHIFGLRPAYKKWAETRRLLLQGEISCIFMLDWETTHSHYRRSDSDVYLGVDFGSSWGQMRGHLTSWKDPIFDPREAKMFKLYINTRVWEGKVSPEVQEQTVRLACDLFQAVDGACGYVDIGNEHATLSGFTSYERRLRMPMPNTRRLWKDVRGAFWGNLLSAQHVRALGGNQFVKQNAPCYKVVSLADLGEDAPSDVPLYLQLTQALETSTIEDYARLESFLAPILISSQGQVGITILHPVLVTSLGDVTRLKQMLLDNVRRVVLLPGGALLVEYDQPSGWPGAYRALEQVGCSSARGYRSIPQLRSMWWPDDMGVLILKNLIPPRPRSRPIFPAILVQPCISGDALEFRVSFAEPITSEIEERLRKLVQEWSTLEYEVEQERPSISACSAPQRQGDAIIWQANLAPVGQDAYIQLVMMLDEFSETVAQLGEVHVSAWIK